MPTSRRTCTVFSWASLLERFWWMRMASRIWFPTVKTGFRLVMGSWKIMAMSLPLMSCIRLSEVWSRFWSSKRISPSGYSVGGLGLSCMMERAVTLLPLPDSPTIPKVSPASSENETPSTALTTPSWVLKYVLRLFTSSIATGYSSLSERPLAARTEGYSRDRVRARGPVLSPLSLHILQNRPVEIAAPLLALLEVLGADVGAQGIEEIVVLDILLLDVTSSTQHVRYFPANVTVNADDVLRPGLAEVEGVEVPYTHELLYGVGMVIHPQIH